MVGERDRQLRSGDVAAFSVDAGEGERVVGAGSPLQRSGGRRPGARCRRPAARRHGVEARWSWCRRQRLPQTSSGKLCRPRQGPYLAGGYEPSLAAAWRPPRGGHRRHGVPRPQLVAALAGAAGGRAAGPPRMPPWPASRPSRPGRPGRRGGAGAPCRGRRGGRPCRRPDQGAQAGRLRRRQRDGARGVGAGAGRARSSCCLSLAAREPQLSTYAASKRAAEEAWPVDPAPG